jgi:hypothetical protein
MTTYEIDFGDAKYWVNAEGPADALAVLREGLDGVGEEMPATRFYARPLTAGQMTEVQFHGSSKGETLLDEVTSDPSRRLVGCSEWA